MKAVIFDRDGVLASFDRARAAARLEPLLPFGLGELEARLRRWHAVDPRAGDARAPWSRFCRWLGEDPALAGIDVDALAGVDPHDLLVAHSDARPALEAVRRSGHRIGVLSNFALLDLDASLHALNFADLIDVARSARQLGCAKPAAEAYLATARALGVEPGECLLIDDRRDCVVGAHAVGMRAIHLDRSGRTPSALTSLAPLITAGVDALACVEGSAPTA